MKGNNNIVWQSLALFVLLFSTPLSLSGSVTSTLHNLSAGGKNEIRAENEESVCVFCHAPHGSVEPEALWNRPVPKTGTYRAFKSFGSTQGFGQPDGASKMCLSCHDGSVALGKLTNRKKTLRVRSSSSIGGMPRNRVSWLGSNLAGLHPISLSYGESARRWATIRARRMIGVETRYVGEANVPKGWLDAEGKIQCTSCHDPHEDPYYRAGEVPHFSRRSTVEEICISCHRW